MSIAQTQQQPQTSENNPQQLEPIAQVPSHLSDAAVNEGELRAQEGAKVGSTNHSPSRDQIAPNRAVAYTDAISTTVRVPGTYPPEWLPDYATETCMSCQSPFTLIKRRHHCRSCGKIFCGDCCKQKKKLLYLDNKEARVCNNCFNLIEITLSESSIRNEATDIRQSQPTNFNEQYLPSSSSATTSSNRNNTVGHTSSAISKIHGVLKTSNQASRLSNNVNDTCNISNSSSSEQHSHKQVIFSDGMRPGTDLSEPSPCPLSPSSSLDSSTYASFSVLSRQTRRSDADQISVSSSPPQLDCKKVRSSRQHDSIRNITVCDELGYLPPIVISKDSPIANSDSVNELNTSNSLASIIINQFKSSKRSIQASMESRSCPLNGVVKFEDISSLVGVDGVITFLLLKSFYLKAKIVTKECCIDQRQIGAGGAPDASEASYQKETDKTAVMEEPANVGCLPEYWCFVSSGLDRLGQDEVMFVLSKDTDNSCIPRDIFKVYLTLHELALRRQTIENLGNLLFQDGLFGSRDTAGLLFVQPSENHCVKNLIVPDKKYLIALVLQRWEVPWSKVFPMRLLLRLGHKYEVYPYPIVSYKTREPVYYEIGHTIISILGDFRNFRYSLTHVDGMRVMIDKASRKVTVQLNQSSYLQFSKVLDSSNNEHVLAWSSCPFPDADGHLVSVQNDEGQYETVEFYKKSSSQNISFKNFESGPILGASFIVFSGALKLNQTGQPAKISIVEDGLLIQIQSCTMSALRNAIHYMDNFDIDCEMAQDALNRVEIRWQAKDG